jgi:hypothetical protein
MTEQHPEYDAYLDDPDDDATDILSAPDAGEETPTDELDPEPEG